jgi:hypothetical protein
MKNEPNPSGPENRVAEILGDSALVVVALVTVFTCWLAERRSVYRSPNWARHRCQCNRHNPRVPKPSFTYNYSLAAQLNAIRDWRDFEPGRRIPAKTADHLLLATWKGG